MAIQAWTGSGVVGPIDVMGPQESPRQGQGCAGPGVSRQGWLVGLSDVPCLGGLLVGRAGPGWFGSASLKNWGPWVGRAGLSLAWEGCWLGWAVRLVSHTLDRPGQQEVMLFGPKAIFPLGPENFKAR